MVQACYIYTKLHIMLYNTCIQNGDENRNCVGPVDESSNADNDVILAVCSPPLPRGLRNVRWQWTLLIVCVGKKKKKTSFLFFFFFWNATFGNSHLASFSFYLNFSSVTSVKKVYSAVTPRSDQQMAVMIGSRYRRDRGDSSAMQIHRRPHRWDRRSK